MRPKKVENEGEGEIDAEELLSLFDFDDDLWRKINKYEYHLRIKSQEYLNNL